jgi:putative ABC transport system permease protein
MLYSLVVGMKGDIGANVVNNVTGNIRVRNEKFSENERFQPLQFLIPDAAQVIAAIEKVPGVEAASPQTTFGLSVYREGTNFAATGYGIDFKTSRIINNKMTVITSGSLPSGPREALMTEGLAKRLGFITGDKFTIFTKTATGGSNGITWRIAGIAHVDDGDLDNSAVFVDWQAVAQFLRMETTGGVDNASVPGVTQLNVYTKPGVNIKTLTATIVETLHARSPKSTPQPTPQWTPEVKPWQQVSSIYALFQVAQAAYTVIGIIFFILAGTVIYNTTMMAVLERKKEIATLMALGMAGGTIRRLFLSESFMLSCIACLVGVAVGAIGVSLFHIYGLDLNALGGSSTSGFNFPSFIYPQMGPLSYLMVFVIGVAISVIAAIGPTRMVYKVEPAEALREDE